MEKIQFWVVLIGIFLGYSILIGIQIEIFKEILKIKKILWKVAENEMLNIILEKTNKKGN